jgi:uncharacterized protein Yka (UPF0111/DUF47 family)
MVYISSMAKAIDEYEMKCDMVTEKKKKKCNNGFKLPGEKESLCPVGCRL